MTLADPFQLIGTIVAEKYRVDSLVARGGFALVYRATHLLWDRPVALKVFRVLGDVAEAQREKLIGEFLEEGRLLAELSERSAVFVQARDVGTLTTASGAWMPYMVLEWLEGQTLDDMLRSRQASELPEIPLIEAVQLLEPIAAGLSLAHSLGVAHRDIKPGNIFLVGPPGAATLKLFDFGIAKVVQDAHANAAAFDQTTGDDSAFTPAYGAPEQFSRSFGATGPWTDVYSLALVLLHAASGRRTWAGKQLAEIALAACNPDERPGPTNFQLSVTPEVDAIFARALALQPSDRYRSAGEFWSALQSAFGLNVSSLRVPVFGSSPSLVPPVAASAMSAVASIRSPNASAAQRHDLLAISAHRAAAKSDWAIGETKKAATAAAASTSTPPSSEHAVRRAKLVVGVGGVIALAIIASGAVMLHKAGSNDATITSVAPPPASTVAATAVATATADAGLDCPLGMIAIPGGSFFMGSDRSGADVPASERPAHRVTLRPYCLDRFEVTTHDYVACANEGVCKRAEPSNEFDGISAHDKTVFDNLCTMTNPAQFDRYPINCVDWSRAMHFCTSKGKRLPSEAEWEFAARGPDGRIYPWGDEPPSATRLNACGSECVAWGKDAGIAETPMYPSDDGFPNSAPVGSFPAGASRYGVEDVVGNVWEWVDDWYAPYDPRTAETVSDDPRGPSEGTRRVIRGGGWNGAFASWVRPSFRYSDDPKHASYGIGFRCAK